MAAKKILVTGASGTIGTRLCEKLLERRHDVIGLDNRPNKWNPAIDKEVIKADVRRPDAFADVPAGVETVVHLAANALVYPLVREPRKAMDNMEMVFNALEFARKNGVKEFIFGSSREVYGNSERIERKEEDVALERSESPYAATKMAAEALIRSYKECYGIDFIIIRFSNVYGMYDDSDRLIPRCIRRARKGEELEVYGRDKLLDFTYIDDAVNGIVSAIENFGKAKNETYNIATGRGTSILKVVQLINTAMGGKSKLKITDSRTGEVIKYIADISKAKRTLGFYPKTTIEEGVRKSIQWYENQK